MAVGFKTQCESGCLCFCAGVRTFASDIFCDVLQAPEGENQPSTEVDLFVSSEKIMVLNTDLQVSLF